MRWLIGLALATVAFILALVCLFGAWFNLQGGGTAIGVPVDVNADYGLRDVTVNTEAYGMTVKVSMEYSDYPEMGVNQFVGVLNVTQVLVILAIVFTLLMVILAALVGTGKIGDKPAVAAGLLAVIFTVVSFAYFFVAVPPTLSEESDVPGMQDVPEMSTFWGSESMSVDVPDMGSMTLDFSWGPGYAWYLMIIAFLCALFGTLFLIGSGKKPEEVRVAPPIGEPQPQYGYPITDGSTRGLIVERPEGEPTDQESPPWP